MPFIHPITKQEIRDFFVGVIAPMFTPANEDGSIDIAGLQDYTKWLVKNPTVTTLFCRSGVGRMYSYSIEEAKRAFEHVLEIAEGKKTVFCGTSGEFDGNFDIKVDASCYIDQTLKLSAFAKENGAAAVVLVVPAGIQITNGSTVHETILHFFKTIHENTDIPIIIYNPQNLPAEYHTTPRLVRELSCLPRIIGMKLSTTDMYWMGELIRAGEGEDFVMVAGSECAYYQAVMTGAIGVIGQGCSIYPHILRRILDAIDENNFAAARRAQFDVNHALEGFQNLMPDISGFAYLRKKGLKVSPYCRDGTPPLDQDTVETIYKKVDPICREYA